MLRTKPKTAAKPKEVNTTTPRQAALVLIHNWMTIGAMHPARMCADDMTYWLKDTGYNVTEKRREQILKHVENLLRPLQDSIEDKLQQAGFSL